MSFTFGGDVVRQFLRRHDLDLVVRAHQVVEDGYEFFAGRELVTVFSAPNYCGEFDNAGAMMTVDDTLMCSFQILKPASAAQQRGAFGGSSGGSGNGGGNATNNNNNAAAAAAAANNSNAAAGRQGTPGRGGGGGGR